MIPKKIVLIIGSFFLLLFFFTGCISTANYTPGHHEIPEPKYVPAPSFPEEIKTPGTSYDPDKKDMLVITATPAETQVYINERFAGTTPLVLQNINEGFSRIRLTKPGYHPIEETFYFNKNENTRHYILDVMTGKCKIITVPADALVDINHQLISNEEMLPVGNYTAHINKFGYQEETVSVKISETDKFSAEVILVPIPCTITDLSFLSHTVINPIHDDVFVLHFMVTAPGIGQISIMNSIDTPVFIAPFHNFTIRHQAFVWDFKNNEGVKVPDGAYRIIVSVVDPGTNQKTEKEISIVLDSSFSRSPQNTVQGISGLVYSALTEPLPMLNMQLDAHGLFNLPPESDSRIPVLLGFRIGAFDNLEAGISAGIVASPSSTLNAFGSLSLKYRYLDLDIGNDINYEMGVFAKLTLHSESNSPLFANPTGVSIGIPINLNFMDFYIVVDPEVVYAMTPFPYAAAVDTSTGHYFGLFAKGGIYFDNSVIKAGISGSLFFTQNGNQFMLVMPVQSAAEICLTLPNTGFFISATVILELFDNDYEIYSGIGLGLLW